MLTRSVYLQQDLVRQFVEAPSDHDRFAAVSELVGAGRVTELQSSLERAKRAWSTVTNQREGELRPYLEKLALQQARLSEVTARASAGSTATRVEAWDEWWSGVKSLGVKVARVQQESREAPSAIDNVINQIEALRRSMERRLQTLKSLQTDAASLAKRPVPNPLPLREEAAVLRAQLEDLKRRVAEEQARLAQLRQPQAELKERTEQLSALAGLR